MDKLVDLIQSGRIHFMVSPGDWFGRYTEIEPSYGGIGNQWYEVSKILKELPSDFNEEELVEAIVNTLIDTCVRWEEEMVKSEEERRKGKSSVVIKESPKGYVYLMKNNRNGYIKIGFTKHYPTFRETTLQSQEPDIELINHWKGSMDDEEQLHGMFDEKRLRGEWFSLTPEDISKVDEYFSS